MLYKRSRFHVDTTPISGDEGVDLIVRSDLTVTAVQCKAYKNSAGPPIARELLGAMVHFGVDKGVLACAGGFTSGVHESVSDKILNPSTLFIFQEWHKAHRKVRLGEL